jgi:hypothetical protein
MQLDFGCRERGAAKCVRVRADNTGTDKLNC